MRLLFTFFTFILCLFSSNGKTTALGGSGSIDLNRVDSVNYFEALLAHDKKEPELYVSFSIKSSHQNILAQTDKINVYNTQKKDIAVNLAGDKVSQYGITSVENALNAIKEINENQNKNMIEYVFPNLTLSYRFRNIGFSFSQKKYGYAYIHSIQDISYDKHATYTNNNAKYTVLQKTFDDYMSNSLQLKERYITLNEFFMSYANMIPTIAGNLLLGASINSLSAEHLSESNHTLSYFNNKTIYQNVREGKVGVGSALRVSYNMSFIFIPSFSEKIRFGVAFVNLNPSTFGGFYYDSKIVFSGNYLLNQSLKLHYEKDLKKHKNIYQTKINERQSFGLELTLPNISLFAGYESNKNIFKNNVMSFGLSYKKIDIGYRTISNFSSFSSGSIKDFGELTISFRKDT